MIQRLSQTYRPQVEALIREHWSGPMVVSRGNVHDTRALEGFVSVTEGVLSGYALYTVANGECELAVLESLSENQGIGTQLIDAVLQTARAANCARLWLITTNDNISAIRFYQRRGFELKAVHIGALEASRRLKPSIPLTGNDDIPLKHEFEFEILL